MLTCRDGIGFDRNGVQLEGVKGSLQRCREAHLLRAQGIRTPHASLDVAPESISHLFVERLHQSHTHQSPRLSGCGNERYHYAAMRERKVSGAWQVTDDVYAPGKCYRMDCQEQHTVPEFAPCGLRSTGSKSPVVQSVGQQNLAVVHVHAQHCCLCLCE